MKNIRICFFCITLFSTFFSYASHSFRSEVLKSVTHFGIQGDRLIRIDSVVIQINERMGDNDAHVGIPYSKGDKVDIVYAVLEDKNGTIIRKLKKSEIKDRSYISDISIYEDDFIKSFQLIHNTYPYRISYCVSQTVPKFLHIFSLNFLRYKKNPIRNATVIVDIPSKFSIKYTQKYIEAPKVLTNDNFSRYVWEYSYTPQTKTEANVDYTDLDIPQLKIIPLNFKYGEKGSWESWQSFGNWIFRLNQNRDILPNSEKKKVDELLNGVGNDRERAKKIYKYLQQNTRYVNVAIDIGGLQTYPADYVCTNKYGDCKALSNYMQALLKYAGVPSYYTLVNLDSRVKDIDSNFAFQEFNHVILTIPFENDTVFLECTSKNSPFGYVHTGIQGRKALLVDETQSRLVSIPQMQPEQVLCTRTIIADTNNVKMETIQRGENYEESNYLMNSVNKNLVDKYIRHTILPFGSYTLIDYNFTRQDADSAQVRLQADLHYLSIFKQYGNNISIQPFSIKIPNYELPENRKSGVRIDYPEYYKDSVVYELKDLEKIRLPQNIDITTPFGTYKVNYEQDGNKIRIQKSFLLNAGRISLEEYKEFYSFIVKVKNLEVKNIYIELL